MSVPLLSMRDTTGAAFADALGASFRTHGFAMVTDHGMDADLIARGWSDVEALFALPEQAKRDHVVPGAAGQRGYTPVATERAKGAAAADLKEFWHVGPDRNVWPASLPTLAKDMAALYARFEATGARLLAALARHLGLPHDWFADRVTGADSILRLLHYPPVAPDAAAQRAGAHEDINLITLLLGAEEGGLELLGPGGEWQAVTPPPGALVVNVGDMLQRLTDHQLRSTRHRVVNPLPARRGRSRYAMPFFLHLRGDVVIEALPQCLNAGRQPRHPPISAGDYLRQRLNEIGLVTA